MLMYKFRVDEIKPGQLDAYLHGELGGEKLAAC